LHPELSTPSRPQEIQVNFATLGEETVYQPSGTSNRGQNSGCHDYSKKPDKHISLAKPQRYSSEDIDEDTATKNQEWLLGRQLCASPQKHYSDFHSWSKLDSEKGTYVSDRPSNQTKGNDTFSICVLHMTGTYRNSSQTFEVRPLNSVASVKNKIRYALMDDGRGPPGIPAAWQTLISPSGTQMRDSWSLAQYNLVSGSQIRLTVHQPKKKK